jgi:hypothetical protein
MSNPNNNKNFNDEALKINRALKKKLDKVNKIVDECIAGGYKPTSDIFKILKEVLS